MKHLWGFAKDDLKTAGLVWWQIPILQTKTRRAGGGGTEVPPQHEGVVVPVMRFLPVDRCSWIILPGGWTELPPRLQPLTSLPDGH